MEASEVVGWLLAPATVFLGLLIYLLWSAIEESEPEEELKRGLCWAGIVLIGLLVLAQIVIVVLGIPLHFV